MTTRAITARSRSWSGWPMNRRNGWAATVAALLLSVSPSVSHADGTGEAKFASVCAACHGDKGVGTEGLAPPLVDPALWQALGDKAPRYIAGVMAGGMSGKITANGIDYVGLVMPPQAELGADDLVAVAAYVLKELNGLPAGPDKAEVEAALAQPPSHKELRALRKGE
ncbi:MAG: cytochrome C [Rhizobium sp.]|nr:MAG: cytochrome C [Rhizobium sp.]